MNAMKLTMFAAVSGISLAASAIRYNDVWLWKGETYTEVIPDTVEVGLAPEGFVVKDGVAEEVRYLHRATKGMRQFGATHYSSFADRVEWGSKKAGVRVLSVTAPADAKPGVYLAGEVRIHVIDRTLPPVKDWKYMLDLWQHPWAVARYFNAEPFSSRHYAAMRPLWKMLADAGQKQLTVTIMDRPWNRQCEDAYGTMIRHIKTKDGKWRFDYRIFDEYVEFGRSCGLGPDIACYTMCPWDYEVSWEDADGNRHAVKAIPGTPEFKEYWGDFLVDFAAHLKAKGWFDNTWICMDERAPEDVRNICLFIAEKAPGLKTFLAGNRSPSDFEDITINHVCYGFGHLTDKLIAEASDRRKQGMLTSFYVCCGPMYPNTLCHNEPEEGFWLGAYPGFAGLDGFLRWAYNSWPRDPDHDASYSGPGRWGWPSGDTYLVYPNGQPSLRFLELKNGIVAAEKLRILKEQGLFKDEIAQLAKKFDRKQAIDNKIDFFSLRVQVLRLVNRER